MRTVLSTFFLAVAVVIASQANAGPPHAQQCTVPAGITLVGGQGGTPDPLGTAVFVIRRHFEPYPGASVVLDFSNCPDVRLSGDMVGPGQVVDCAARTVAGISGTDGVVTFRIAGAGTGGAPRTLLGCVAIYADGVPLPSPIVTVFDMDGVNGVNGLDLSSAAGDMFSGQYRPRSDHDFDGDVDGLDLSIMARAMFAGGSIMSGAACP